MFNFELHITVSNNHSLDFATACKLMNAKDINIILPNAPSQLMSSMTIKLASANEAIALAKEQAAHLESFGFEVLRAKVEVEPKYIEHFPDTKFYYLEVHVPTATDKLNQFDMSKLKHKWHRSANEFKENVTMLTFRTTSADSMDEAEQHDLNIMKDFQLVSDDIKFIVEYAIYDSKESLDDDWLTINRNTCNCPCHSDSNIIHAFPCC